MSQLFKVNSTLTRMELESLTIATLSSLKTASVATVIRDSKAREIFERVGRRLTTADRDLIETVLREKSRGSRLGNAGVFENAIIAGNSVIKQGVSFTEHDSRGSTEIKGTISPVKADVPDRPCIDSMVGVLGSLVTVDNKKFVGLNPDILRKYVIGGYDIGKLLNWQSGCLEQFYEYCQKDIEDIRAGTDVLSLIRHCFMTIPLREYLFLCHYFAANCPQLTTAENIISLTIPKNVDPGDVKEWNYVSQEVGVVKIPRGPFKVDIATGAKGDPFVVAMKNSTEFNTFVGGRPSYASFMKSLQVGIPIPEAYRKIMYLLSMSLGLISKGKKVLIFLSGLGPLPFLKRAFEEFKISKDLYKIHLPQSQYVMAARSYSPEYVTNIVPEGYHHIYYNDDSLLSTKAEKVDHAKARSVEFLQTIRSQDFTYYGVIFSDQVKQNIFAFGESHLFKGVVSSESSLCLAYANWENGERKLVYRTIEKVSVQHFLQVASSVMTYIMSAPFSFNKRKEGFPYSNLICPVRQKVAWSVRECDEVYEEFGDEISDYIPPEAVVEAEIPEASSLNYIDVIKKFRQGDPSPFISLLAGPNRNAILYHFCMADRTTTIDGFSTSLETDIVLDNYEQKGQLFPTFKLEQNDDSFYVDIVLDFSKRGAVPSLAKPQQKTFENPKPVVEVDIGDCT